MENGKVSEIIALLQKNEDEIVKKWFHTAMISEDEPYVEEMVRNGHMTIKLLILYLSNPAEVNISNLTEKIAQERVDANVNIGDFVFNIHIGRKLIFDEIHASQLAKDTQVEAMMEINEMFDLFVNDAVTKYTNIKDEIINNKTQFINEMHSDRLTILGQIAASFAHEFRNPLTSIKGFIHLLEKSTVKSDEKAHYFKIINNEMESLQEKVNQFLYLSKLKILDDNLQNINLSVVVKEMLEFLYPRFTEENITIVQNIDSDLIIFAVKDQIKQVILNILHNAVEELQNIQQGRKIEVLVTNRSGQITVTIANNGPQIQSHMLENIFEPFISTKDLGTGLGLSVCKQIIEKHNGSITVLSKPEKTSFFLTFPESHEVN
jgi:signal transduction histidine kinase